jgi:hypothetical protein
MVFEWISFVRQIKPSAMRRSRCSGIVSEFPIPDGGLRDTPIGGKRVGSGGDYAKCTEDCAEEV